MANADLIDFVKNAEHALLNAQVKGDQKALEDILADDFVGVNPDGSRVTKQEEIQNLLSTNYSSGDLVDLKVHSYDGTAVATGHIVLHSKEGSHRFSFTDVYVNQKLVSSQATLMG